MDVFAIFLSSSALMTLHFLRGCLWLRTVQCQYLLTPDWDNKWHTSLSFLFYFWFIDTGKRQVWGLWTGSKVDIKEDLQIRWRWTWSLLSAAMGSDWRLSIYTPCTPCTCRRNSCQRKPIFLSVTCKYWLYVEKVASVWRELQELTTMRPFLSVMNAKAHGTKFEVCFVFLCHIFILNV